VLYANGFRNFDQQSALFSVNKATGTASYIGQHGLTLGRQMNYSGLGFEPNTGTMYAMGSQSASLAGLYTVDKGTGAATYVSTVTPNFGVDGAVVFVGPGVVDAGRLGAPSVALSAWPSPSRQAVSFAFTLASETDASVTVHDLAGRRVATLVQRRLNAGPQLARWDGLASNGARVADGVYFATLRVNGATMGRATIVLVR
jgi:hypothetical protein